MTNGLILQPDMPGNCKQHCFNTFGNRNGVETCSECGATRIGYKKVVKYFKPIKRNGHK